MADPLAGLKNATGIGPAPPSGPIATGVRNLIDSGSDALRGLVGIPGPDTSANRFGGMMGAAAPFVGEGGVALPKILEDIFASNPGARAVYDAAHAPQVEDAIGMRQALSGARTNMQDRARQALMDINEGYPRPIPTDTGYATAIPLDAPGQGPISGSRNLPPTLDLSRDVPLPPGPKPITPVNRAAPGFESKFSVPSDAAAQIRNYKVPGFKTPR